MWYAIDDESLGSGGIGRRYMQHMIGLGGGSNPQLLFIYNRML